MMQHVKRFLQLLYSRSQDFCRPSWCFKNHLQSGQIVKAESQQSQYVGEPGQGRRITAGAGDLHGLPQMQVGLT